MEVDAHRLRLSLRERLRREHVLHLGRADAERERPEGTVRRGVAVTADDRHPRLRDPELGTDDVDDPLVSAPGCIQRHAELLAIVAERVQLTARERIRDRSVLRGNVVVHRRDREVGPANPAPGQTQTLERLGRGHLVNQVQVDVEQRRLVGGLDDDVAGPDPVEQRLRCHQVFLADGL